MARSAHQAGHRLAERRPAFRLSGVCISAGRPVWPLGPGNLIAWEIIPPGPDQLHHLTITTGTVNPGKSTNNMEIEHRNHGRKRLPNRRTHELLDFDHGVPA